MRVTVVIATHGDDRWRDLAWSYAYPSLPDGQDCVVIHDYDATLAEVRNRGAAAATGDWLAFLDSDDQLDPGFFRAMETAELDHSLKPRSTFGYRLRPSGVESIGYGVPDALLVPAIQYVENGRPVGRAEIPSWGRPLIEINCAVIGTLIPKRLFDRIGGFRELPIYEDWDLWTRAVIAGAAMIPVPEAVYRASRSPGGRNNGPEAVSTYWRIRNEHEEAYRAIVGVPA